MVYGFGFRVKTPRAVRVKTPRAVRVKNPRAVRVKTPRARGFWVYGFFKV